MKPRMVILALLLLLLTCPSGVMADTWSGHYEVTVNVSPLPLVGVNSYTFTYYVKTLDQGSAEYVGLDYFYVQVPLTANITKITDPPSYGGDPGVWGHTTGVTNPGSGSDAVLEPDYLWLSWAGLWPASVYPFGETATFSFDASNVVLGQHQGTAVTYWSDNAGYNNTHYTGYEGVIQGPAAVPLPGTLALLGPGLLGLAVFGRRRIFKK